MEGRMTTINLALEADAKLAEARAEVDRLETAAMDYLPTDVGGFKEYEIDDQAHRIRCAGNVIMEHRAEIARLKKEVDDLTMLAKSWQEESRAAAHRGYEEGLEDERERVERERR